MEEDFRFHCHTILELRLDRCGLDLGKINITNHFMLPCIFKRYNLFNLLKILPFIIENLLPTRLSLSMLFILLNEWNISVGKDIHRCTAKTKLSNMFPAYYPANL